MSYQITLPDIFDEFDQACVNIDNQIRANKEARDSIPRTEAGQFAPAPTTITSTGTHSGPMDLSGARYHSQKQGSVTNKRRSVAGTTTCSYTVACLAIGHPNAPTNDQEESPLLLPPPPQKEVCLFLLLGLLCLLLLLPLPKSSMRQKTNFRCSRHSTAALQDASWECSP